MGSVSIWTLAYRYHLATATLRGLRQQGGMAETISATQYKLMFFNNAEILLNTMTG